MRRCAAEALGTFVLVFGGCGAAVLAGQHVGFAGVAAAFGLSLLVMVYTVGPISGCHLNPAVTLGLVLAGKFDPRHAPGYMVAQVVGAVVAAAVLYVVASGTGHFDAAATGFATNGYGDRSPGHELIHRPLGVDHALFCFRSIPDPGDDTTSNLFFYRESGRLDFSLRAAAMVRHR